MLLGKGLCQSRDQENAARKRYGPPPKNHTVDGMVPRQNGMICTTKHRVFPKNGPLTTGKSKFSVCFPGKSKFSVCFVRCEKANFRSALFDRTLSTS